MQRIFSGNQHKTITVTIPPKLIDKKIKEIRIIPKLNGTYFEFQYTYEAKTDNITLSSHKYISIDIGVNNLVTAIISNGNSFIIDGKYLKSINQWFNKRNAYLQSIHMKQVHFKGDISKLPYTNKQNRLLNNSNKIFAVYVDTNLKIKYPFEFEKAVSDTYMDMPYDFSKDGKVKSR